MNEEEALGPISRRQYLTMRLMHDGVAFWTAQEAIASTAMEHPEWDMDERKTFMEWELTRG